jgi:integrase
MLNCGFYQSDLSGLSDEKVDWKEGRITHKREKTKKYENVPTIDYKLWPETFRLLKKHRSGEKFVLLSSTGKQLVTKVKDENGKTQKNDHIHQIWKRWCNAKGLKFPPLKCLRKTGGNALKNRCGYGVGEHYLGHAPRTIGEKHYFQPPTQLEFDAAVAWLAAMA